MCGLIHDFSGAFVLHYLFPINKVFPSSSLGHQEPPNGRAKKNKEATSSTSLDPFSM